MLDEHMGTIEEDRIRLSRERRAEQAVVELGQYVPDLRRRGKWAECRPPRDVADRLHSAPSLEVAERPDRELLQAQDAGRVRARQPHHLLEKRFPTRRLSVPVEQIPGPDEQAFYCTADARRARRPARLYAGLRPCTCGRTRTCGSRRRARDVALSLWSGTRGRRVPSQRTVLSGLVETLSPLAAAAPAQSCNPQLALLFGS